MKHLVDKEQQLPYTCAQCKHFKKGFTCAAFAVIPPELYFEAEKHNKVIQGQNGAFTFEAVGKRDSMRVYELEDTPD